MIARDRRNRRDRKSKSEDWQGLSFCGAGLRYDGVPKLPAGRPQQEQDAQLGRLVCEVPEKRRTLVCLEREAIEISNALCQVAEFMLHAIDPAGYLIVGGE